MDKEKLLSFITNSFLKDLFFDSDITDISYNGQSIFYLHNHLGRRKSDIQVSEAEVRDFIRQIANLTEKQFSYQSPKLDVSVDKYRINAVHTSIARTNNGKCINFSIRIAGDTPRITKESTFLNAELISLFDVLVNSHVSLVIGGMTGSGKTEFQKYLIGVVPQYSRLIIIDNILELDNLHLGDQLDINVWQADEKSEEANIQELVKNALRSNPDWLIVAESRGKEMIEVLNSAMTGHPIITTVHAFDINSMPTRIARMVMMNSKEQNFDVLMQDIFYNFRFYIYLKREIKDDGMVLRYIEEVSEFDESGNKSCIYRRSKGKNEYFSIRNEVLEKLKYQNNQIFIQTFVKEKK